MSLSSVTDAITTSLYEGILESAQWMGALQTIQTSLQCAAFHQLDIGRRDFSVQSVAVSMAGGEPPSEKLVAFERYYAPQDIRLPAMWQFTEGAVWCDHEQLDRATLAKAPIYTEFLVEPQCKKPPEGGLVADQWRRFCEPCLSPRCPAPA